MSTLNVESISHPTPGSLATINGTAPSNRNLVINGAMQVAQRGTQVTGVTSSGFRTADRFKLNLGSLGTWTVDQDTSAPNGFSNSFKVTCTTADASPASGDNALLVYQFEGQDLQSLGFGTSDAKNTTLSFWVRSNKTGNASFTVLQTDNSNKLASFQYSISSADTWEYKTITIPADTAGVISNDNGEGLQIEWWLNGGSNYTSGSHRATWTTFAQGDRNPSNLGVGGATSDYFAITGVQLEVGSAATPFEHRSFGDELVRCQRYYEKSYDYGTAPGTSTSIGLCSVNATTVTNGYRYYSVEFAVEKRGTPVITTYAQNGTLTQATNAAGTNLGANSAEAALACTKNFAVRNNRGSNITVTTNCVAFHYQADAEL